MANTQDATGKRTFDDVYTFPSDSQDLADDIDLFANVRRGTAAERAALAPGLARNGLLFVETDTGRGWARIAGAWVPFLGVQPEIAMVPGTTIVTTGSAFNVNMWSTPGTGQSVSRPNSEWFSYNSSAGDVTCLKAGRYQILVRAAVQAASGGSILGRIVRNGNDTDILTQDTVQSHPSWATMLKLDVASVALNAGDRVRMYVSGATAGLTIGGVGRAAGEMSVKYLGVL